MLTDAVAYQIANSEVASLAPHLQMLGGSSNIPATVEELKQGTHDEAIRNEIDKFASLNVWGRFFSSTEEARAAGYQVIDMK